MTCIVGVEHEGVVYMGADSISLNGWGKDITAQSKIFKRSGLMFGFTGNPRMAQIIKYLAPLPPLMNPKPDIADEEAIVIQVIEPIRKALREYGYTTTDNGQEQGANFLLGYNGKVYEVCNSFQLCHSSRKMCAMGLGEDYAMGALYATLSQFETWTETAIMEGINHALMTSAELCSGVAGPFFVWKLTAEDATGAEANFISGISKKFNPLEPPTINKEAFVRP